MVQGISCQGECAREIVALPFVVRSRGICNLAHLAEEQTHRISVDLDDHAGVIDLFVTITGTNPTQEAANESDNSSNTVLDFIPSKLTDDDIERYVCIEISD